MRKRSLARPLSLLPVLVALSPTALVGCSGGAPAQAPTTDAEPADVATPDGSSGDGSSGDATNDSATPDVADASDAASTDSATSEAGADGGGSCACDLTPLCDVGCACDIACSITPGAPPLGPDAVVLDRAEVAAYFPSTAGGAIDRVTLRDDAYTGTGGPSTPYAPLVSAASVAPMTSRPVAFASDVDQDGRDEVVLVGPTGVTVEDWDGSSLGPRTVRGWATADFYDGAAADLLGNGGRNLVVSHQSAGTLTIEVLDVPTTGTGATVRASLTLPSVGRHAIAVGRPTAGATPQVYALVAGTGPRGTLESLTIHTYSLSGSTLTEGTPIDLTGQCLVESPPTKQGMALAVGNVDADPASEIGFAVYCDTKLDVALYDPGATTLAWINPPSFDPSAMQNGAYRPFVAVGHLGATAMSTPMLAVGTTASGGPSSMPSAVVTVLQPQFASRLYSPNAYSIPSSVLTGMAVRDTDGDGVDEVLVAADLVGLADTFGQHCTSGSFGCTEKETGALVRAYSASSTAKVDLVSVTAGSPATLGPGPVVAAGDVDADSMRVRATGNVYLHTGRPFVNAVIAAPPTWLNKAGVTNVDGSGTSFGVTSSTSTSDSRNISATASITASADADFEVAKFSASVTASVDFTATTTSSQTVSYGTQTSVGPDADLVSFRAIPYASYEYRVVSHPNPLQIGKLMTIDVPGKVIDTVRTLADFRAEYGTLANDVIPPSLFTHAIGDPTTYPKAGDCVGSTIGARIGAGAISAVYRSPLLVDVGNATSGANTLNIDVGTEMGQSVDVSLDVEMAVGVEAGGVGLEASAGFGAGWSHETTVGKDVSYQGTVGYLSQGYGVGTRYQWGLCVYDFADSSSPPKYGSFPVVDYVVQPY